MQVFFVNARGLIRNFLRVVRLVATAMKPFTAQYRNRKVTNDIRKALEA